MGAKKIETRSWNTKHRGPILIHASASISPLAKKLCEEEPFKTYIRHWTDLPTGVILGQANLVETFQSYLVGGEEEVFGDYSANRFCWRLSEVKIFNNPIPAKGQLGIWNFEIINQQK